MKRGKTDAVDAEAICEAVTRPAMRFVPVKPAERQAALLDHKACDLLVRQRIQIVNAIRAHVGEFGVVVAKGIHNVDRLLDATRDLPDAARPAPGMLASQLCDTQARTDEVTPRISEMQAEDALARKPVKVVAIALANRMARTIRALIRRGDSCRARLA